MTKNSKKGPKIMKKEQQIVEIDHFSALVSNFSNEKVQKVRKIFNIHIKNILSENTKRCYLEDLKQFSDFLSFYHPHVPNILEADEEIIIDYRHYLANELAYSPNSMHRKLSALSSFYREYQRNRIIQYNPLENVKREKATGIRQLTKIDDREVRLIAEYLDEYCEKKNNSRKSMTKAGIIYFLLYTGARTSTILNIKVSDIKDNGQYKPRSVLLKGKGGRHRHIALHPKLDLVTKKIMGKLEEEGLIDKKGESPLFIRDIKKPEISRQNIYDFFRRISKKVGIPEGKSLHSFRRSVITKMLEDGVPIEKVAEVVGHLDINTTKRYKIFTEKIEDDPLLNLKY